MVRTVRFLWFAFLTDYNLKTTLRVVAVDLVASWFLAVHAFGDVLRFIAKGQILSFVENITLALP